MTIIDPILDNYSPTGSHSISLPTTHVKGIIRNPDLKSNERKIFCSFNVHTFFEDSRRTKESGEKRNKARM